jgi:hypothetical protein
MLTSTHCEKTQVTAPASTATQDASSARLKGLSCIYT